MEQKDLKFLVDEKVKIVEKLRRIIMPITLENKLSNLINEIKEIKKDLILQELKKTRISKHKINKWKTLGEKVSSKWDNISVIEEINQQREKSW